MVRAAWSYTDWAVLNKGARSRCMLWWVQNQSHGNTDLQPFILSQSWLCLSYHEVIQNWYHWNNFFCTNTYFLPFLLCLVNLSTALILSGPPQYNFTFQVKNNSACRILLLSWNMSEDKFQTVHFQGKIFNCFRTVKCSRRCFHKFLMACYFKRSTKVMPFNIVIF